MPSETADGDDSLRRLISGGHGETPTTSYLPCKLRKKESAKHLTTFKIILFIIISYFIPLKALICVLDCA